MKDTEYKRTLHILLINVIKYVFTKITYVLIKCVLYKFILNIKDTITEVGLLLQFYCS